jgi:hypothetical protein
MQPKRTSGRKVERPPSRIRHYRTQVRERSYSHQLHFFGYAEPASPTRTRPRTAHVSNLPAHYIAQANREKLGGSGMDKIVAFDQSRKIDDFPPLPGANSLATNGENKGSDLASSFLRKRLAISTLNVGLWCARRDSNPHDFTHCHLKAARLPIPPRALLGSAPDLRPGARPDPYPINGADVTNQ